jgi:hypothetical protein
MVMYPSTEIIKDLLETLVSPKFDGILEYGIEYSTHDDTGDTWLMVDVIFDMKKYNEQWQLKDNFDDYVITEVRNTIKYLSFNPRRVIVEIYVIE